MLPFFVDEQDAIQHYKNEECSDAVKAYIVAYLSGRGMKNRDIRNSLGIENPYTVTHLKKAGTCLTEEQIELWNKNPRRITLGHVRALNAFKPNQREEILRNLLVRNTTGHQIRRMAKGEGGEKNADIKKYEELMSEVIGRPISIEYDSTKKNGSLNLKFFSLEELDDLSKQLGFNADDHF